MTRFEAGEMPWGKHTSQRLRLWSTSKTILAAPGGISAGSPSNKKSGPNWTTGRLVPFTNRLILTWAEWPPTLENALMDVLLLQNARAYASLHSLQLAELLGFGIHGSIWVAENKPRGGQTAVKAHHSIEPYLREREAYEFLKAQQVSQILEFHVPQLVRADDDLRVIEMTIVIRPFVLDFASAYLESAPEFSPEIWAEWEAEKCEQFGARWPRVQRVLEALENLGLQMMDVSPNNIAFPNQSDDFREIP